MHPCRHRKLQVILVLTVALALALVLAVALAMALAATAGLMAPALASATLLPLARVLAVLLPPQPLAVPLSPPPSQPQAQLVLSPVGMEAKRAQELALLAVDAPGALAALQRTLLPLCQA